MQNMSDLQQKIEQLIKLQDFSKKPAELYEPIAYTMLQGGKRLRPMLTLLACDLFGENIEQALYPALAVEVFHNFTLVHDDIMDKAPLRRGKETVYKKWNANIAILSGDTMFAMAYQYAIQTKPEFVPAILKVFSKAAIEVCEGQQLDMNFEAQEQVSIDEYLEMIRLKTAVLLGAALEIGAIIGKASTNEIDAIYNFGINMGIAFQLKDDLLDVYGQQEKFGKKSGGDIATNKKTYLYLRALECASAEQLTELKKLYTDNNYDPDKKIAAVKQIFDELQIEREVSNIMKQFYDTAIAELGRLNVKAEKKQLLADFSQQLFNRTH
jgi:geranylgeranyl diphosphate synthase, type II